MKIDLLLSGIREAMRSGGGDLNSTASTTPPVSNESGMDANHCSAIQHGTALKITTRD